MSNELIEARAAMEIGAEIAGKYEEAVKAMAEMRPDVSLEQLLRGNRTALATLIMRALMDAKTRATL